MQTAHYMDTVGIAQTTLSVKLPSNYTNNNTICYAAFNTVECVAGFKTNVDLRTFISPLLPVNKAITVVVISKQAGDYYLGTFQTTTTIGAGSPTSTIFITPIKNTWHL